MQGEDVKVELHSEGGQRVLVVSGEKNHQTEHTKKSKKGGEVKVWRQERTHTSFSRAFTLPQDAKDDGITARMEHGVLTVEIPKAERPAATKHAPKRIRVDAPAPAAAPNPAAD
mmetsp:Transcript_31198/g.79538  ORF Transcript_31198/g.79538 Transcript_31198/m.79538 type:complete len:114 (-) Transcript_31198:300-641(-)